ncbi:MAG: zf-HC2 domain-containing protein [Lachnospiraceae bacterium]|nr:zf-HC2 domain-containing protein [Ruminococcus sp.]MCM1276523.1 zf-HC2 domain-containing protein [Lachnospiraceae bacterium]
MNENKITCDICRDLIPLVGDGVASADSEAAVRGHIAACGECAALFDGEITPEAPSASPKALLRAKRWLNGVYGALMLLGLYFGLSLTDSADMFLNCLIMPIAGAFGYLVFRWRALFAVPVIVLIMQVLITVLGLLGGGDGAEFLMVIFYILFALAGIAAAMLLHYAFGRAKSERSGENERCKKS